LGCTGIQTEFSELELGGAFFSLLRTSVFLDAPYYDDVSEKGKKIVGEVLQPVARLK